MHVPLQLFGCCVAGFRAYCSLAALMQAAVYAQSLPSCYVVCILCGTKQNLFANVCGEATSQRSCYSALLSWQPTTLASVTVLVILLMPISVCCLCAELWGHCS